MPTARRAPTAALLLAAALAAAAAAAPGGPARAEYANPYGVAVIVGNRSYANERVPDRRSVRDLRRALLRGGPSLAPAARRLPDHPAAPPGWSGSLTGP